MFVFFSGKLGCVGSLLVSVVLSALLILLLRACTGARVW
jgi:hypothetical protein